MPLEFRENLPTLTEAQQLNVKERDRAHLESEELLKKRQLENPVPTDDERRIGVYIEMIEPQMREALLVLTKKGYKAIDSGYDGRQFQNGVQYIGFEKEMISTELLPLIQDAVNMDGIEVKMEFDTRDFLELVPERFLTIEEWKEVWKRVAGVFPDRGIVLPFRERFIDRPGH